MSKVDEHVKNTFDPYRIGTSTVEETEKLINHFIASLPTFYNGYNVSIVGRVGHGKSIIANTAVRTLLNTRRITHRKSKLFGRNNPAWQSFNNSNSGLLVRRIDMAAYDAFNDAVIPSLQLQTINFIEHAKPEQQKKSVAVIYIQTKNNFEDGRIIDIYINPDLIASKVQKKLNFK